MRKFIFISAIVLIAVVILAESGVFDALLIFLLSGSLPGTSVNLTPSMMMAILAATAWLLLTRVTALGTLNVLSVRRFVKRYAKKQARMPKRRYSRI